MSTTSLFFDIFGRDQGVGKMFDSISGKGKIMSGIMIGVGAKIGSSLGEGIQELGKSLLETGFEKLGDLSKGTAQLEAGIKSTGGAAHVSKDEMLELADSIQSFSGQTDDSIMQAEGLLLTFTNIKNQGPNKIFDEATVAAANMAAKMGGDASTNAILLGKALNDPTKGLTALTRVGVAFSAGQTKTIKSMQASGNIMGAQKIILGELTKEFGGAAQAAGNSLPGQLKRAHEAFQEVALGLVEALLPAINGAVKLLLSVAQWAQHNQPIVRALAIAVGILTVAFIVLSAAMAVAASPFIWIGLLIAALVAGLVIAYNRVGWFKDGVNAVFSFIVALVQHVISFIVTYMVPVWVAEFHIIAAIVTWLWSNIIAPYFNLIISIIRNVVNFVIGTLVPGFVNSARWIANAIIGAIDGFNRFKSGVILAIAGAVSFVEALPGRILGAMAGAGSLLYGIGQSIIQGLFDGLMSIWGKVTSFVGGIAGWIKDHKGPLSYDATLLTPAGEVIMGGLNKALRSKLPDLGVTLGLVTDKIQGVGGTVGASVPAQSFGANLRAAGGGRQTPVVYVQNPFTGEYLLGKVDDRVGAGIGKANDDLGRRPAR